MELKRRVEAVLFAAGRALAPEDIAKLCRESDIAAVKAALAEIRQDLDARQSSLLLVEEGAAWKLTVRESYLPFVRRIVPEAELPKSILETLAFIAYKAPVLQSQVVKVRSTKSYDHLARLEELGFLTRERKGRTKLIKLTQKFFSYFDISPEKLQARFKTLGDLEQQIERKEIEIEGKARGAKPGEAEVELVDRQGQPVPLETYPVVEKYTPPPLSTAVEVVEEKLDGLEVFQPPAGPHEHEPEAQGPPQAPAAAPPPPGEPQPAPERSEPAAKGIFQQVPAEAGEAPSEPEETPEAGPEKDILAPEPEHPGHHHEHSPESIEAEAQQASVQVASREGERIFEDGTPPEIEKLIQEKAERILHPRAEAEEPKPLLDIEIKPEQLFTPLPKKRRSRSHETIEDISAEEAETFAETGAPRPPEAPKDMPAQPPGEQERKG
jgi:segregation and condensation protein B